MGLFTDNYENDIMQIFKDNAHIRVSGTPAEAECAEYIRGCCRKLGLEASIEPFEVDMCDIHEAKLTVDGEDITCKGYRQAGSGEVSAELYYMPNTDAASYASCRGKIVLLDGVVRYWNYQELIKNGAAGIITYDGNKGFNDDDIDLRELRSFISKGVKLPCVSINVKSAIKLVNSDAKMAKIVLRQDEFKGESHNVILDMPGEIEDKIILTAHYDSVPLSQGIYDNMSGSVGLLGIAKYFSEHPHRYSLRFVWCGSEERGLLGSKAYCAAHEAELANAVLNINLDMIGCIMGRFIACCSSEDRLVHYIEYLAAEMGWGINARQGVYSSDSTPFADKGVPAVSFARLAPPNTATIHNRYDTIELMKPSQMVKDIEFITAFTEHMACAAHCPVGREIPDSIKDQLDYYLFRKKDPHARD